MGPTAEGFKLHQSGWYVQGVYQFLPEWRAGLRYDQLDEGSWNAGPVASANGRNRSRMPTSISNVIVPAVCGIGRPSAPRP